MENLGLNLNLWLWLSAANQLWKILNQLKSEDVIESILNCEKMWKAVETERRCNLRTLVFTVFSRFLKATYSTSVSGIRINFMFKICQIVPDLFHKFLKPYCWRVFFSIWPNCATAANLEVWLGGHRRLLHYYLNGLQPLCSPLRFSFGLFGPGKQKKILNLKNLSREDRLFSGRGNTVQWRIGKSF